MSNSLEDWVKSNKKRIAREFVRKTNFVKSEHPVGIITAGLPGAGKTEFTQELIKQLGTQPLRIDMDEIAKLIEGYRPEIADKFRAGASAIMNRIYDEVLKAGIDFILDGTFAGAPAIRNVERAIAHGYTLRIYYIYQDPRIAWEFTQAREKVEHRSIDKEGFMDTYARMHENLRELQNFHDKISVSVIIKDKDNKVGSLKDNIPYILQAVPTELSRIELEDLLK